VGAPLVIRFAPGARLHREADRGSDLPILRNGPPGTFVDLPGVRISLPTDQVVVAEETGQGVRVGFGGMRYDGVVGPSLTFSRVRDLRPAEELSPDRSWIMTLAPAWVSAVEVNGVIAWGPDSAGPVR